MTEVDLNRHLTAPMMIGPSISFLFHVLTLKKKNVFILTTVLCSRKMYITSEYGVMLLGMVDEITVQKLTTCVNLGLSFLNCNCGLFRV